MDIAALSTAMSEMQVATQTSVKITEMAMDTVEEASNGMIGLLNELPTSNMADVMPYLGQNIDVSV